MDNLLDYMDQSFFLDFTAQRHGPPLIQFTWIYEHDLDLGALRRFQANLGIGLLGRCVERSPLPFGRHRWVKWNPPHDLDVSSGTRARSEVTAWTDEQAARPIDFENGPPWLLAVQPLSEGGAAVTLVVAHGIADGMAVNLSISDAVNGTPRDLGYPAARSRARFKAFIEDLRQTLRNVPQVLKAMVATPLAARDLPGVMRVRSSQTARAVRNSGTLAVRDAVVKLPSVTGLVDTRHWDERAAALNGTSNPLLVGLAAKLCEQFGWVDVEGSACLMMPVNERTTDDTRGNALTAVPLIVDPSSVSNHLTRVRADIKSALATLKQARNQLLAPLPLLPFVPKVLARQLEAVVMKSANLTVSHFGDLEAAVNRPDGTDAEWFSARHARWATGIDAELLRRAGGVFFPIASGRLGGRIYISLCYANADGSTTTDDLRRALQNAFDDFGISGIIV